MKDILVRITKLSEVDDPVHPNNIEEGFVKTFHVAESQYKAPELNERFTLVDNDIRGRYFSTSEIQEILDDNTFKTYNSIYKWEVLIGRI